MIELHDDLVTALKGRYEIERELGQGGMAVVYLARDLKNGRKVALKVLRPPLGDSLAGERFLQEIAIAAPLVHPNIVAVHDSGEAQGLLYYTMPYVEGPTLRERIEREVQLPIEDAISIARQVASALDYAHKQGAVHRDIKPDNILLLGDHVLVADFGLARAITRAASKPLTTHGIVVGTPSYMSPEQCTPGAKVGAASDIYSLGCVVFEMIAGVPPFRGATVDVLMSHHQVSAPPSLCDERRRCPEALDKTVRRALAKAPADRYRTAGEFVQAMEAAIRDDGVAKRPADRIGPTDFASRERTITLARRAQLWVVGALIVLAAATALAWRTRDSAASLDPSRIVVFPLRDERSTGSEESGEAVATYIGYALDETRPLKWLEAWDLIEDETSDLSKMGRAASRELSARARAGYFIDGTILRSPDSVTVVLRLHSVGGDSLLRIAGISGPLHAYLPKLALRAVADLLPAILKPGRVVDLSALAERRTSAIANFLQGEREYRRMQFMAALAHYQSAVREDSALAIAALKGAQTATWLSQPGTDTAFIEMAFRQIDKLTAPQASLARGLRAYLLGDADSSVAHLRMAIRQDSLVPESWTLLGEVYARSLTTERHADSLARASLQRARSIEPDFAPALLLLQEFALRDGDLVAATRLKDELRRAGADTVHAEDRELMWGCVEKGPASVRWAEAARRSPGATVDAGRVLARGFSQPACARAALLAVFQDDSANVSWRRGALLTLNGLLISGGRPEELRALLASKQATGMNSWQLHLVNAAAGAPFAREASAVVDSLGRSYAAMSPPDLWHVGSWLARTGDRDGIRAISVVARAKADSSRSRRDELIAQILGARATLADGDTAAAISELQRLRPNGARRDIAWRPWEGLGLERLLLAELLLARGESERAIDVASWLDATEPVPYLLYQRPSLEVRLAAAKRLRNQRLEAHYRGRLEKLSQ